GNRLSQTLGSETSTYGYEPGTNRVSAVTGASPQSFSYDAHGNTTRRGNKTLTYNQDHRLIEVKENTATDTHYVYDGNGRRIKKAAGEVTTVFHYDRSGNLIGESTPTGAFTRVYYYLGGTRLALAEKEPGEELAVKVSTSLGRFLPGVKVYAFTQSGTNTGKTATTDETGTAVFEAADFSTGTYKFRADYLGSKFWSDPVTMPGAQSVDIHIQEAVATVLVTQDETPEASVKVYLFNATGTYLGLNAVSDETGKVSFNLPVGQAFKFRADILGSQFFSETVTIVFGGSNNFQIASGGGSLTVTVDKGEGTPIPAITVFLFNSEGRYLGVSGKTSDQGQFNFDVPSGTYKIRADYLGYQFWTPDIVVSADKNEKLSIAHQDVTISVEEDYAGDIHGLNGINVHLFLASGSSLGKKLVTSDLGKVTFNLPEKEYKVRADYLGQQYWSEIFNGDDETVTIEAGKVLLTVSNMGHPLSNVKVYVFNSTGNYLGVNGLTDGEGQKAFPLPPGSYNFRADYLGTQFWSGVSTILADIENPVTISTGGGNFALTVLKGDGTPLAGVKCSLFNASGSSNLHLIGTTTSDGVASFPLADGTYKIRIDYLGYQFWTEVFGIPQTDALTHTIAHQDVTISVNRNFAGDIEPGSGLKLYLFTPAGGYLGVQTVTDNLGRAEFSLPLQEYKVRANYLSEPYWSDSFLGTDKTIVINEGGVDVQVAQGQTPLANIPVYVFNDAGVSLGINGRTTAEGLAGFRLPEGTYKFRADYQKGQFWATEPILSHQDNIVDINTGGGAVTIRVEKAPGSPLTGVPVYVFSANGAYFGLSKQSSDQGAVSFDLSDGSYKFRVDYLGYSYWSNTISVPSTLSEVVTIAHQDVPVTVESLYRTSA
ncbi:MAG: carboxypeptidase regulatory-like domain-containing protein, partial [Pseudomonadota bacterium]